MIAAAYADELRWLREGGRAFARAHPQAARWLAEPGADPDVERLLEGVAFLCARIRGRLDAGRPELTHALLSAFLPHLVRSWPAMALLQLTPPRTARGPLTVPAGAVVESEPVDGERCRFRTACACAIPAVEVAGAHLRDGRLDVELRLRAGADPARPPGTLRLHCHGEPPLAMALRHALLGSRAQAGGRTLTCRAVGLETPDALLPDAPGAPAPWRMLAEYLAFPAAFLAVDVDGCPAGAAVTLSWDLPRPPRELAGLQADHLCLGVVPAVNAWPAEGDPITVDPARREHRVRVAGRDPARVRVLAITAVEGLSRAGWRRRWPGVLDAAGAQAPCWQELRRPAAAGGGEELHLALAAPDAQAEDEVLSLSLLAGDGEAAGRIAVGDLRHPGAGVPPGVQARNLAVPTRPLCPALLPDLHRRLLEHLACGSRPLADLGTLVRLIALHDLRAAVEDDRRQAHDRLHAGLLALDRRAGTRLLDGLPVRTLEVTLDADEDQLGGLGAAHLLGGVLERCLAGLASLNTATAFAIRCRRGGEHLVWPVRLGSRTLA